VIDALVSHLDVYPTLCDLAGIEHPPFVQGRSLLPLAHREAAEIRDEIFAEATFHAAYEPQRCVRTPRYKYIRRYGDRATPVLPNTDDGPSKDLLLSLGWAGRRIPFEQLYDLAFDPNEAANLADDPEYADLRRDLSERLDRWMRETGDPLLDGPVRPPSGARVNLPDQVSPSEPTVTAG
jgi:N-sulfoglucosamine sulfohydrolase